METKLQLSNDLKDSLNEFAKAECLKDFVKDFKLEFGETLEPISIVDHYVEFVKILKRTHIFTKKYNDIVAYFDAGNEGGPDNSFKSLPNLDHLKSNIVLKNFNERYRVTFSETLSICSDKDALPDYLNRLVSDFFNYSFFKKFALNFVPETEFDKVFPEHLFKCKIPNQELV